MSSLVINALTTNDRVLEFHPPDSEKQSSAQARFTLLTRADRQFPRDLTITSATLPKMVLASHETGQAARPADFPFLTQIAAPQGI